ncbi:MAG: SPFH/Band 7/PHB domain protein [Bacteroidaceae bacterium]|nr:SPFH/Band 7/PHB domain protein [Bacteroidaceae bacterium]
MPIVGIFIFIVIFLLVTSVRVVRETEEVVTEFLGKHKRTLPAGIHILIPIFERVAKRVNLKEQILDAPPQPVITKDNVTMQVDSVVYYRVFDSTKFAYGATNPIDALANITATTLRNIVGELDLDGALTSRELINAKMTEVIDRVTDEWGIKVTRVELRNIMPPAEIRAAMETQMKAEREKRQTLLEAEAHKAAVIARAEGDKQAMVLAAEGERDARIAKAEGEAKALLLQKQAEADGLKALMEAKPSAEVLELRRYDTLVGAANGRAAKIIIPTDLVQNVSQNVLFSEMTEIGSSTKPAPAEKPKETEDPCCD